MVAVLVLVTFVIFVVADAYLQRRQPRVLQAASNHPTPAELPFPLSIIAGFKLPANLAYHPGHTWAMKESPHLVRIGLDDFAARLVGHIDEIQLPTRGRWLRQGEDGWEVRRGEHRFKMLSPIEGEIVDRNEELLKNPSLAHLDPYGAGWLLTVVAPAAEGNFKNLLRGGLAHRWMEESVGALQGQFSSLGEAHMQDGGRAVADLLADVPEERWDRIVQEIFLA